MSNEADEKNDNSLKNSYSDDGDKNLSHILKKIHAKIDSFPSLLDFLQLCEIVTSFDIEEQIRKYYIESERSWSLESDSLKKTRRRKNTLYGAITKYDNTRKVFQDE